MSAYAWFYAISPEINNDTNFLRTDSKPNKVTIPLGGTTYVDIDIDGINNELIESNYLTMWKFNNARIVRTRDHIQGNVLDSNIMYTDKREVYKAYGSYYVSTYSEDSYLDATVDSLLSNESYTAPCPDLTEDLRIKELPSVELPRTYGPEGAWRLPTDVRKLAVSQSSDDMSYYKEGWYLNYNFRYQKYEDAVIDAATRVCAISHEPLDWWYDDGSIFIAKAGDQIACIRQLNYTSCYYVSSNDLSYVLLNLGGK